MTAWVAALLAAVGVWCWWPARPRPPVRVDDGIAWPPPEDPGWMRRHRWLWCLCTGVAGACFVSGRLALPAGGAAAALAWVLIGRTEPPAARRRREREARELPGVVHLLAAALETGCDVPGALRLVCRSCPGPAADLLATVPTRLLLGVEDDRAWQPVLDRPSLAPLARAMVRAGRSGASVADEVSRLAEELSERARADVEARARAVGVKAALPLGLCLLPSFVLVGVVPLAVALLRSLAL